MSKEFHQIVWDDRLRADLGEILRLAVREDLDHEGDWTSRALVGDNAVGRAEVVARQPGIMAGLAGVEMTLQAFDPRLRWLPEAEDGQPVARGGRVGRIEGPARGILVAERSVLNLLGRLCGIATLARRYVEAVAGTAARIYDTRKTTPGWRRLEKYAVRCGGGRNHRTGLFEAVLIKDNHLALGARGPAGGPGRFAPAEAVARARAFVNSHVPESARPAMIIEVEVDTLEQLDEVLPTGPDVVLLDNMSPADLSKAVARRNACNTTVELEASGGVSLETVRRIAGSGVERISVGALTHSAVCLDLGLDWLAEDVA
ncbi:MAG: carboxylating nicotinate-nucleotide diphosphorylase [Pirellulales bacterium]|nr:carboxylating nicotinate-nucleotide diphosphorylase [Pirellulales bacterium]